ncbi:unnamed protein product, partial (macronuclear) [Paramecium tetraurelia]
MQRSSCKPFVSVFNNCQVPRQIVVVVAYQVHMGYLLLIQVGLNVNCNNVCHNHTQETQNGSLLQRLNPKILRQSHLLIEQLNVNIVFL